MSNETESTDLVEAFGEKGLAAFSPKALMSSTAQLPQTNDKPFLSFKDGEWSYGADQNEVEDGSLWAVNPNSFKFGYIEWCDSQAGAEFMVPAGQSYKVSDLEPRLDVNSENHRISPQVAVDMYCATGEDAGTQVTFKTSTRGGVDALNELAQKVSAQYQEDPENFVALVYLQEKNYMHKKYRRKTYVPVLELHDFTNFALDALKDEKPSKSTKGKKAASKTEPAGEASQTADKPSGRRRRRT